MTDLRQAAQQALETLKSAAIFVDSFRGQKATQDAITALKAALEQQAEPVAWNKSIRDSVDSLLEQAGYQPDSSARHQLAMMNFDATPSQRKPLTVQEIAAFVGTHQYGPEQLKWFRLGESAHGIKEGT